MKRVGLTVLSSSLLLVSSLLLPVKTIAQVTSDGTLSTTVTSPDGSNFTIEGGNRPSGGGNLFHSFQDFSVPTNGSAVFNNAPDIANIISRVTGGNFSSIDGLIKANGSANLFLINPAGIIFGQNAKLDIGGSFFGSTADSLLFPEGEFSAVNPDAPPLLTIDIPIGLRFRDNPQPIANLSVADGVGLQVNSGQTLALMGGDILFAGGRITAPGANIELGGLFATGTINLDDNFKFSFPEGIDRADVSFFITSQIDVASDGGGSININAADINLTGGSRLLAGIAEGLGNPNSQAGNIVLNATGDIILNQSSIVQNQVEENAIGNAGAIDITTANLTLTNGGTVSSSTFAQGNAGTVKINASDAISIDGLSSSIRSSVDFGAKGNSGGVEITAANLTLTNGGTVSSSTFAQGNAGTVKINASDAISIDGLSSSIRSVIGSPFAIGNGGDITINTPSLFLSSNSLIATSTLGQGNAGNILINATDSISITEDSQIQAATVSEGNAGNIVIDAENADIFLSNIIIGTSVGSLFTSGNGQGGDIKITGRTLSAKDGASLLTATLGKATGEKLANAGNIQIDISDSISFDGGSHIFANTSGQGNAGNVTINAGGAVSFDGADSRILSSVFSLSEELAAGFTQERQGGNISITARALSVQNGASFNTGSFERGNAGNITLDIQDTIKVSGFSPNSDGTDIFSSRITSSLGLGAEGKAGNINITARSLLLEDGGRINNSTSGIGNAGNITIDVDESIELLGSSTISNSVGREGVGNGADITINTPSLSISNTSITTSTSGKGNAGNIFINATDSISITEKSLLQATTFSEGNAGNIVIEGENTNIFLSDAFIITSVTFDDALTGTSIAGNGQGGDIKITGRTLSLKDGASLVTITAGKATGEKLANAGNIQIDISDNISFDGGSLLFSNTSGQGNAGNVTINAGGDISFDGAATAIVSGIDELAAELAAGFTQERQAGDINIRARALSLKNGAFIDASTFARGDGGDITINTSSLSMANGSKISTSTLGQGNAGNILINATDSISITGNSQLQANTLSEGNAGNIVIDAENADIFLSDMSISTVVALTDELVNIPLLTSGNGQGGDIKITGRTLSLKDGASLFTSTSGKATGEKLANAGNIQIDISDSISFDGGSRLFSNTFGQGNAGNVTINAGGAVSFDGTDTLILSGIQPFLSEELAAGFTQERQAGDINIRARSLLLEDGARIDNNTFGIGDAGNITIDVDESIELFSSSSISNSVGRGGIGNGGDLDIKAKSLTLREGSQISAVVSRAGFNTPGGTGTGGDLRITTTDFIDISGVSTVQLNLPDLSGDPNNTTGLIPTAGFSSGIRAASQRGASGDGGNITITTDAFRIADGAVIDNSTTNDSNAGNITINANTFEATGGGQIITATRGNGKAADIKLNITDNIFISGSDPTFASRLARAEEFGPIQGGDNIVTNQGAASGIFANTSADSTGDGGNIFIGIFKPEGENLVLDTKRFTQEITLADGAKIAADSQGEGSGGAIFVQAEDFTLDNQAEILAETTARQDNNTALSEINLGVADILQLKNDSKISTQALSNADGGNININAKFIVAFPGQNEGSDILTRAAQEGTGGDINITTEALFGIEERKATPGNKTNDIDASSQFGLSGQINITRPDVDPTSGLLELTEEVVDPSKLIAQNVCTQTANSEFVDIGKGGLPQNPEYVLEEDAIKVELVAPIISSSEATKPNRERAEVKPKKTRKPPAQGWIWHENGIVELVAYNPNKVGEQRTWDNHRVCQF